MRQRFLVTPLAGGKRELHSRDKSAFTQADLQCDNIIVKKKFMIQAGKAGNMRLL